jgi:hypothetical protein
VPREVRRPSKDRVKKVSPSSSCHEKEMLIKLNFDSPHSDSVQSVEPKHPKLNKLKPFVIKKEFSMEWVEYKEIAIQSVEEL